jgi:hypothetical protein
MSKASCAAHLNIRAHLSLWTVLLRAGGVEAGVVEGGVGVGVLEEAVGVGGAEAEVQPGLQVGAGLDVKVLAGQSLRLQKDVAIAQELDGAITLEIKKCQK